jgi:hypothetical protein
VIARVKATSGSDKVARKKKNCDGDKVAREKSEGGVDVRLRE